LLDVNQDLNQSSLVPSHNTPTHFSSISRWVIRQQIQISQSLITRPTTQ